MIDLSVSGTLGRGISVARVSMRITGAGGFPAKRIAVDARRRKRPRGSSLVNINTPVSRVAAAAAAKNAVATHSRTRSRRVICISTYVRAYVRGKDERRGSPSRKFETARERLVPEGRSARSFGEGGNGRKNEREDKGNEKRNRREEQGERRKRKRKNEERRRRRKGTEEEQKDGTIRL